MKQVKHIALFKFKPEITPEQIAQVWQVMENLPKEIPGILSLTWGPDVSVEGLSDSFEYSVVITFENLAARDTYLPHPVHQAAVEFVVPKLERVIVIDHEFTP